MSFMQARLYYEENCSICKRLAEWVHRKAPPGSLELVPTDYTDPVQLPIPVYSAFFVRDGHIYAFSEAVLESLRIAGYGPLVKVLSWIPRSWRDRLYRRLAARRTCARKSISCSREAR